MTDRFTREITLQLPESEKPWPLLSDVTDIFRAAFAKTWPRVQVEYSSRTDTKIGFIAADPVTLRVDFERHGGVLAALVVRAQYWNGSDWLVAVGYLWPKLVDNGIRGKLEVSGPLRVDVEAFTLSIQRSLELLKGKKRWTGLVYVTNEMQLSSQANGVPRAASKPVIRAKGLKPNLLRWFSHNKDEIIIGLATGLIVTVATNIFQAVT